MRRRTGTMLAPDASIMRSTTIDAYMTPAVHTIGKEQTLEVAHEMMRRYRIRHLPVLTGGRIAGTLSLRDLHLLETLRGVDPAEVTVEEAMTSDVYVVEPKAELRAVATRMAKDKLGSAIVARAGKIVGMFTTVDALRALADALAPEDAARRPRRGRK